MKGISQPGETVEAEIRRVFGSEQAAQPTSSANISDGSEHQTSGPNVVEPSDSAIRQVLASCLD